MNKKAVCPEIKATFYKNGTLHNHTALLDLGFNGESFFWGGKATNQLPSTFKLEITNIKKNGIKMIENMNGSTADIIFDSVRLFDNQILKNSEGTIIQSGNGLLMSNQVWFGNGILKKFGKVYFDFKNNIIYVPRSTL